MVVGQDVSELFAQPGRVSKGFRMGFEGRSTEMGMAVVEKTPHSPIFELFERVGWQGLNGRRASLEPHLATFSAFFGGWEEGEEGS
jgi:ribosome modulation factor